MDKKNLTIGILLLVAAFAFPIISARYSPPPPPAPEIQSPAPMPTAANQAPSVETSAQPARSPDDASFAALVSANADATTSILRNDYIELHLTDFGGAVQDVALQRYSDKLGSEQPYVFNQVTADPILAFAERSVPGLGRDTQYQLVSATDTEVIYRTVLEGRLEITRRYALAGPEGDPYRIRTETSFRNLADHPIPAFNPAFALGTTALASANDYGQYLNVATYDTEGDTDFISPSNLQGGGFLSLVGLKDKQDKTVITKNGSLVWASVKDQFFASIFTPDEPGNGIIVRRVQLPPYPGSSRPNNGITGAIRLNVPSLEANATATISGELYVGPKEYTRLASFDHREDKVMQFERGMGKFVLSGVIAPIMNRLMNWMHGFTNDWGVAIILMTLALKLVTMPLTLAASKSAKRMQKFQPEIAAIRAKFKDNPQKLNQATLELFKKHKINPAGGCLPILITIPLFIAFYSMLMSTAELRFQSFLWARDLSAPDTVTRIFGLPINVMPLLMGVTMVFQMRLTPSPATDNAQVKMMKFMPIVFTLICYNFAAALALYSTINGVFTIGQQLIVNRMKDPATDGQVVDPAGAVAATRKGKKIKNVTPKRK